jgi:hypothetical protein
VRYVGDQSALEAPTMNPRLLPATTSGDLSTWDQAVYAFLVETGQRSGSRRTVESYSRMLWRQREPPPPEGGRQQGLGGDDHSRVGAAVLPAV